MNIHWQIPFKSLRSGTVYTVNIYDPDYASNTPIVLKGGAKPFVTDEYDDDDPFIPVRTQSGYIRIVDDGKDASGNTLSSADSWEAMIPNTDIEHPVTLTHVENLQTQTDWQGFMQAQNFGAKLYENPQEREFPVQCPLSVLAGFDINYDNLSIKNFAYILQHCLYLIGIHSGGESLSLYEKITTPGAVHISNVYIQGGDDAKTWMLKRIDWQTFVEVDADGEISAAVTVYEALEEMCRYWGLVARIKGPSLYLTCLDDNGEDSYLQLDRENLTSLSRGTSAGLSLRLPNNVTISDDNIYANTNQDIYINRGPHKATIEVDGISLDEPELIDFIDDKVVEQMEALGWQQRQSQDDHYYQYTYNLQTITRQLLTGSATYPHATFNEGRLLENIKAEYTYINVIRILSAYNAGDTYATLATKYSHVYNGKIYLHADIYDHFNKYNNIGIRITADNGDVIGNIGMYMRLRIGGDSTDNPYKWYDGETWSTTRKSFKVSMGNESDLLYPIYTIEKGGQTYQKAHSYINVPEIAGPILVEFLGSDDLSRFEISHFTLEFQKTGKKEKCKYVSSNNNYTKDEFEQSGIFATDNNLVYGYGIILNADNTYMKNAPFNGTNEAPEQHLADRVTAYWETVKRRIDVELFSNDTNVKSITPLKKVVLEGFTIFSIAFRHEWRDDITKIKLLETS